jgi:hypothetical protein
MKAKATGPCTKLPKIPNTVEYWEQYIARLTEGIRSSKDHIEYLKAVRSAAKEKIKQLQQKKKPNGRK